MPEAGAFTSLARVVLGRLGETTVSGSLAFLRAATRRGLLRCGRVRGNAASTPPPSTGVSLGPPELLVSLALIVSQSSRTRLHRAQCVIFRLTWVWKR